MGSSDSLLDNEPADLRRRVAARLDELGDQIADDASALFPLGGSEPLDAEYCLRVGRSLVHLLASAVLHGHVDTQDDSVGALRRTAGQRSLSIAQLFAFTYSTERAALDELALDPAGGATSEAWPLVVQLVRRGSFDLLGAYSERAQLEPSGSALLEAPTGLYARPVLETVLAKEGMRAGRAGQPIALILFDVDHLGAINETYGRGVGDQILERVAVLIRKFFREHDWVARHWDDSIAVLLPLTDADRASGLAERARDMVEKRLGFIDHETGRPARVTVSAAVVNVKTPAGGTVDPDRVLAEAEAALGRAKQRGRNRVERLDSVSDSDQRKTPV